MQLTSASRQRTRLSRQILEVSFENIEQSGQHRHQERARPARSGSSPGAGGISTGPRRLLITSLQCRSQRILRTWTSSGKEITRRLRTPSDAGVPAASGRTHHFRPSNRQRDPADRPGCCRSRRHFRSKHMVGRPWPDAQAAVPEPFVDRLDRYFAWSDSEKVMGSNPSWWFIAEFPFRAPHEELGTWPSSWPNKRR